MDKNNNMSKITLCLLGRLWAMYTVITIGFILKIFLVYKYYILD